MQKLIALFLCGILARHLYAMPCYVSEIDNTEDMVRFMDFATEHDWWWDHVEDWQEGDSANLVMFDFMTEDNRLDDVIIRATYDRPVEIVEMRGAENHD